MAILKVLGNRQMLEEKLRPVCPDLTIVGGHTVVLDQETGVGTVDQAQEVFDRLVGNGWTAYGVDPITRKGERVTVLDPMIEITILTPQLVGG